MRSTVCVKFLGKVYNYKEEGDKHPKAILAKAYLYFLQQKWKNLTQLS